jgi:hypothetical protein
VQERDLPFGIRPGELLIEPAHLLAVEIRAVEREEPHARIEPRDQIQWRPECVVAAPLHVERLVIHLARIVVIAESGVERDAGLEQRLVWLFELQAIVFGGRRAFIDVVAGHQHEAIVEALPERGHLRPNLILRGVTAAAVADHRKLDRAILIGERQRAGCNLLEVARRDAGHRRCDGVGIALADPEVAAAR